MAHHSRLYQVVVDVPQHDHDREVAFWRDATGAPLAPFERYPEYHGAILHDQEFALLVQRIDDGAARVHLDVYTDDLDAEVARLEKLGAQRVRQVHRWWIMSDPAGLLFCVIAAPPGSLTDENSQRWE